MISRRKFLNLSLSAAIVGANMSLNAKENKEESLLKGVSDIHIHAAPDSKERLSNELAIAKEAKEAGYKSICFKSNDFSCHDRAFIINEILGKSDFKCFGSLVLNYTTGDKLNVFAVEKALATTGGFCRQIWLPTAAAAYQEKMHKTGRKGIAVLDEHEKPLKESMQILHLCKDANIALASGHCSPRESLILAEYAKKIKFEKFIITHANSLIWTMSKDKIKKACDLGAWVEYCVLTNFWGKGTSLSEYETMSWQEFSSFAKIYPQRSFISTDLGQVGLTHPIKAMKQSIIKLKENGLSHNDIDLLVKKNPAFLMGI
ncbi:DUF6282 family protein [Campylobacter sp. MIT 99-7217]|uniref:DUF6282 family protein n=1 Tax=Campylobacter sp. MIT 99-7217 TaxID=535091 RepID=UPI00163CD923|nr:DUF6282 family protein [Campylobacter sp. MIT 99-7217]